MKCQVLFSGKLRKIFQCRQLKFLPSVLCVKDPAGHIYNIYVMASNQLTMHDNRRLFTYTI